MAFDLDAFRAAHRPWSFSIDGRTFGARHVSAPRIVQYMGKVAAAAGKERGLRRALRWVLRLAFPWRFSYLVRGDPVDLIFGLEIAARNAALADFFACLEGKTKTSLPSKTNGTRSFAQTA